MNIALLSLACIAVLSACSEETTQPPASGNYVVSKTGSYYIHTNVLVDIARDGKTTEIPSPADSTVVTGAATISGKSAVRSVVFTAGIPTDTTYLAQEGSKVLEYFPIAFSIVGASVDLGVRWVTTFDESATSWTALTDTIAPFKFIVGIDTIYPNTDSTRIDTVAYNLSVKLNFTGTKTGTENLTIDGLSVATTKSVINIAATIYVNISGTIFPVEISLPRTYWFAKDVGVLKIDQEAKVLNSSPIPPSGIPGLKQTTVRYTIAK